METTEQPQTSRRLTRKRDRQMFTGVASGIAEYLDVDPWLVRAAFIGITFLGGAGIAVYIAALILLPQETDAPGTSPLERIFSGRESHRAWLLIPVLIVGAIVVSHAFGNHFFWFPLLLVGVGLFMFRDRFDQSYQPRAAAFSPSEPTPAAVADEPTTATFTTRAYGRTWSPQRRRHVRRRRSPLRLLTVGSAILALGITVALIQAGAIHLRIQQVLAVPMVVLGIGLLVGTFFGRARSLIVPALLLLPFTVAATMADVPIYATAGAHTYRPAIGSEVQTHYSLGAGRLILDLSKSSGILPATITVDQGAGFMVVVVPQNIAVNVDASEGAGVVQVLGRTDNGRSPHLVEQNNASGAPVQLKLRNGFGRLFVTDNPNSAEAN